MVYDAMMNTTPQTGTAEMTERAPIGYIHEVVWPDGINRSFHNKQPMTMADVEKRDGIKTHHVSERVWPVYDPNTNEQSARELLVELDKYLDGCPDPDAIKPKWLVRKASRLLWLCRTALRSKQSEVPAIAWRTKSANGKWMYGPTFGPEWGEDADKWPTYDHEPLFSAAPTATLQAYPVDDNVIDVALKAWNRARYEWSSMNPDNRDEPQSRVAMRAVIAALRENGNG